MGLIRLSRIGERLHQPHPQGEKPADLPVKGAIQV
jgi:hypothetical protein